MKINKELEDITSQQYLDMALENAKSGAKIIYWKISMVLMVDLTMMFFAILLIMECLVRI